MIINWYGENCFKIQTSGLVIVTDPFSRDTGLEPPRFKADIIIKTFGIPERGKNFETKNENGEVHSVIGPGEYDVKGIEILGFPAARSTVYSLTAEAITLGILGTLSSRPEPAILEELGGADILFVPAGGEPHLKVAEVAQLLKQISPKIVIPALFKIPGLKREAGEVKKFLDELGFKAEPEEKLSVKKKDLPNAMRVALLKI